MEDNTPVGYCQYDTNCTLQIHYSPSLILPPTAACAFQRRRLRPFLLPLTISSSRSDKPLLSFAHDGLFSRTNRDRQCEHPPAPAHRHLYWHTQHPRQPVHSIQTSRRKAAGHSSSLTEIPVADHGVPGQR